MPEISVIIPAYQHGDTIAACLDSVFNQTFKDIEVIVVNDGSTDDTETAIAAYRDRIIYRKTPNSGPQKARNLGFSLSAGRFVIFLDADIDMKPEMLQALRDELKERPDAAYAYCGFRFGIARFKGERFDADRLRRLNFIHTSALIRRESFPGFDESIKRFQDWDLWLTMLERGKVGAGVERIMFSAKPRSRFGMSQWRPKMFFSPFLEALGIKPKSVQKYRAAAAVIAQKHGLDLSPRPEGSSSLWPVFLAVFALSAVAFAYPLLGTAISLVVLVLTIMAGVRQLVYGAGFLLAELVFGSLAGKTLSFSLLGQSMPLRYAIFAAVAAIWLVRIAQRRVRRPQKNLVIGVIVLLAAVAMGTANGLLRGYGFKAVFSDANAYLALPLVWIFVSAVKDERDQAWLKSILKNSVIALSILTVAALYFFSHKFFNAAGVFAYKWLRDSRIAEITALDNGTYRIFIQSQIYCLLAFVMIAFRDKAEPFKRWAWGIWPAAALVISMSRSFILGFMAAGLAWIALSVIPAKAGIQSSLGRTDSQYGLDPRRRSGMTKEAWLAIKKVAICLVVGVIIFLVALKMPFPEPRNQKSFQEMLISNNTSERAAAVASRWSLLEKLDAKIMESPFLGSGFGATVTYVSSDPRIVSTTGGSYTTAAFEWNYHDILVKMGLFGLLAYGYLLAVIFLALLRAERRERLWLIPAFFALLALNVVSPFLNHPLGIGCLALLLALAERKRGGFVPVAAIIKERAPALSAAVPAGVAMSEE